MNRLQFSHKTKTQSARQNLLYNTMLPKQTSCSTWQVPFKLQEFSYTSQCKMVLSLSMFVSIEHKPFCTIILGGSDTHQGCICFLFFTWVGAYGSTSWWGRNQGGLQFFYFFFTQLPLSSGTAVVGDWRPAAGAVGETCNSRSPHWPMLLLQLLDAIRRRQQWRGSLKSNLPSVLPFSDSIQQSGLRQQRWKTLRGGGAWNLTSPTTAALYVATAFSWQHPAIWCSQEKVGIAMNAAAMGELRFRCCQAGGSGEDDTLYSALLRWE